MTSITTRKSYHKQDIDREVQMPIIIEQIEKLDKDPGGMRKYRLRINGKHICVFRHKRSNGLAGCLLAASNQVLKEELEIFVKDAGG